GAGKQNRPSNILARYMCDLISPPTPAVLTSGTPSPRPLPRRGRGNDLLSILKLIAEPHAASVVLGGVAFGDGGVGGGAERGLRFQAAGDVDLYLDLRSAGEVLFRADIDVARDIFPGLDRGLALGAGGAALGAADRKAVETELLTDRAQRIEAGTAAPQLG